MPRDVLIEWLTYLRKFHPTLPFKCNTQMQKVKLLLLYVDVHCIYLLSLEVTFCFFVKGNLGSLTGKISKQLTNSLTSNQAIGAEELIGLLKNYARVGSNCNR